MTDDLFALTPLDGRYRREAEPLRDHFSEFAFIRDRARVEIAYFTALAGGVGLVRVLTEAEQDFLSGLADSFSVDEARQVKDIEKTTRHDVKAIENFLRACFERTSLADSVEWIHFALTSEDVNNIAQAIALRDARDRVLLPALDRILAQLAGLVREHKSTIMLARTHGQPAIPTSFGKEMAVFLARLDKQRTALASHRFEAKLTGAAGGFNAAAAAAPQVDWLEFSREFIRGFQLEPNLVTTQIPPYDNWVVYFNNLHLANSILLDLAQDMWQYISADYLRLRVVASEVGSSTMPQKVNPIDFENAEGNLGIANSLFEQYARKLTVSRLQRDLSDSTVRRTFGTALGHCLVAYTSLSRGLERIEADAAAMKADLEGHWEIVAEGAQTILRAAGIPEAYELLKSFTRGREITQGSYRAWVDGLNVNEGIKSRLRLLSPATYIGLTEQIAEQTLNHK